MASNLDVFLNQTVLVNTADGRIFVGTLIGYDQSINLILNDSTERIFSVTEGIKQVMLGLQIIKGNNVVFIRLVDEELDKQVDIANIKAEPLNPIVH